MGANCSSPIQRKEKVTAAFCAANPVLIGREGWVEVESSSFDTVPSLAFSAIQETDDSGFIHVYTDGSLRIKNGVSHSAIGVWFGPNHKL